MKRILFFILTSALMQNCGNKTGTAVSDTETTIALRFERDDWYIDDFSPSKDGNDDKKYLRETIRQGLKFREQ